MRITEAWVLTAFRLLSEREGQWHDSGPQCKTTCVFGATADHISVNVVACCMTATGHSVSYGHTEHTVDTIMCDANSSTYICIHVGISREIDASTLSPRICGL